MRKVYHRAKGWYERNEARVSSFFLILGFVIDSLTLRRIDLFRENAWIFGNILLTAGCILIINYLENKRIDAGDAKQHFWTTNIMQFAIGNQLGTMTVFYFKSAALSTSWPFFLVLLGAVIANEIFRKHHTRLAFHASFLYLSLFTFLIFAIPVLTHRLGVFIFLISGFVSLVTFYIFLLLLKVVSKKRFVEDRYRLFVSVLGIYLAINVLYFTNLIPPIPLSLKDGGAYHLVSKNAAGEYVLLDETRSRLRLFDSFPKIHLSLGETVYAYSAVFSPTNLDTQIIHSWEHFDEDKLRWRKVSRIALDVQGGSTKGWRTYSSINIPELGKWRVAVETPRGQVMGYLRFEAVNGQSSKIVELIR